MKAPCNWLTILFSSLRLSPRVAVPSARRWMSALVSTGPSTFGLGAAPTRSRSPSRSYR